MEDQDMRRQVARRAALWTLIALVGSVSGGLLIRGMVVGMENTASQAACVTCVLAAVAAATLYVSKRVEDGKSTYARGYQDGYADGRRIADVLPFPDPDRSPLVRH